MDTRITPFGNHPDGGKISELDESKPIPDYMMPISEEAKKILDKVPVVSRVDFILNSTRPELKEEREFLLNKLKNESPNQFREHEYARCKRDFMYWAENYFNVVNKPKE